MENINKTENIFKEFRSAHRIINECQCFIQDLIFKLIMPKFELAPRTLECQRLFCEPLKSKDSNALERKTFSFFFFFWAWDLIYTHVLEYYLGKRAVKINKNQTVEWNFSIIQISDTGCYQTTIHAKEKRHSTQFPDESLCDSLLVFKMKTDGTKMHTTEPTIRSIVNSKKHDYISSSGAVYYKVSLSEFVDRQSSELLIDRIKAFFKEYQDTHNPVVTCKD